MTLASLQRAVCLALLLVVAPSAAVLSAPVAETASPQAPQNEQPLGIALEGFPYPYPVKMLPLVQEGERLRMAYLDVAPKSEANGRTVLLLHGRNFPSSYWQGAIEALAARGYRVVVPDQIGFAKSSKPAFDLHFDQLARNTAALLDELQIDKVDIVGHSMGGMLAVRFARTYPERVERIVLAAPIGLEDYRLYVPPVPLERLMELEDKVTAESYHNQLIKGYSLTLPPEALDPYVGTRIRVKGSAEYPRWLRAFANSYQMIWREPVVHEIPLLPQKVLFIMGENDHLAPGRDFAPEPLRGQMGQNAKLAQDLAAKMKRGRVEIFEGIGHLVHLEAPQRFNDVVLRFLDEASE
jgi:pimeloyl-ACP methyl ester carboxylesterase